MVFAGVPFLFYFLPACLAAYYAIPQGLRDLRNLCLLVASLLFYAWGEGAYVLLLFASIAANHALAQRIARGGHASLIFGVAFNLAGLGAFKYAGFIGRTLGFDVADPHLPLGISFFTFHAISFLVDVARKDAAPPPRLVDSALYIAAFPQLIAGPIIRYHEIAHDLHGRKETGDLFAEGVRLFVRGLAQKALLANLCAGPADAIFALPAVDLTTPLAWAGLLSYTLQIYFDFAGYSNMAMGLGCFFGFRYPRNFDYPYAARSVTAFWRRWHMSLSRWFRDYLYVPLGGNRHGAARTLLHLWIVFVLCGLWHGAAWTFVLWGAWHGAFLTLERIAPKAIVSRVPAVLGHLYLPVVIALSWVLFRAESVEAAGGYYAALFGYGSAHPLPFAAYFPGATFAWIVGIAVLATPLPEALANRIGRLPFGIGPVSALAGFALVLVLSLAALAGGVYNPFIYFQF